VDAVKNQPVSPILQQYVLDARVAPAATAGHVGNEAPARIVTGAAGTLPGGRAVSPSTVFDLASVSKPVVACTLARLASRGELSLSAPLRDLVPAARGSRSQEVPLELLLAHRAGLEAHRSLFAPVFAGRPLRRDAALFLAADARRSDCLGALPDGGFAPLYSDLGYLLLGAAIEAATGRPLDEVVEREVAQPLGLGLGSARQLRRRLPNFDLDVAPTEVVRARGGTVRGVVHDENAWAMSGHAAAGHAGLFGTVEDVLGFAAALLRSSRGQSGWLEKSALWTLVKPRPGGTLRAGFDSKSVGVSSAGEMSGPETFGHLGFTGTSMWCDPTAGVATVLLTNRVYPTRDNPRIRTARPLVHDALFASAKALLPAPPNP